MDGVCLQDLNSPETSTILVAIIRLSQFLKTFPQISREADEIFHDLTPLLMHNHYKIRAKSFECSVFLLRSYGSFIIDSFLSLPNALSSTGCVHKTISELAFKLIEHILRKEKLSTVWEQLKPIVASYPKIDVRERILGLLLPYSNRLPMAPILHLIDDPSYQIRTAARKIINIADPHRVRDALGAAKISFEAMQSLVDLLASITDGDEIGFNESTGVVPSNINLSQKSSSPLKASPNSKVSPKSELTDEEEEVIQIPPIVSPESIKSSIGADDNSSKQSAYPESPLPKPQSGERLKPLGKATFPAPSPLPFKPRDLSDATWLERMTYLQMLSDEILRSPVISDPPNQILDCVLSCSFPFHKKVLPLIPPLISHIVLHNPEVLKNRILEIVRFFLFSLSDPIAQQSKESLEIICLEANPIDLIEATIKVATESSKPLQSDQMILLIYSSRESLPLSYNTLCRILCHIINSKRHSGELLSLLCTNETSSVEKFSRTQSKESRAIIFPFLKLAIEQKKKAPRAIPSEQSQISELVKSEISKGANCDLQILSASMTALNCPNEQSLRDAFNNFLGCVSRVPLAKIESQALVTLCTSKFQSPFLLTFLSDSWKHVNKVRGLSRIVWFCPSTLLKGSDAYYVQLLALFCRSSGRVRLEIVPLLLAIQKVTEVSPLEVGGLEEPHRRLLEELMAKCSVSSM